MSDNAVCKFGVVQIFFHLDNVLLQQLLILIPRQKYTSVQSFRNFLVISNDIFAMLETQPKIMQIEHWMITVTRCQKLLLADSFDHDKQMIPAKLQSICQRLHFLCDICRFCYLQVLPRKTYSSSRC